MALVLVPSLLAEPALAFRTSSWGSSTHVTIGTLVAFSNQALQTAVLSMPVGQVAARRNRWAAAGRIFRKGFSFAWHSQWVRLPALLMGISFIARGAEFARDAAGRAFVVFQSGDGASSVLAPIRTAMKATMPRKEFAKYIYDGKFLGSHGAVERFSHAFKNLLVPERISGVPQVGDKIYLDQMGVPEAAQNQLVGQHFNYAGQLVQPAAPPQIPLQHMVAAPPIHHVPPSFWQQLPQWVNTHSWEIIFVLAATTVAMVLFRRWIERSDRSKTAQRIWTMIAGLGVAGALTGIAALFSAGTLAVPALLTIPVALGLLATRFDKTKSQDPESAVEDHQPDDSSVQSVDGPASALSTPLAPPVAGIPDPVKASARHLFSGRGIAFLVRAVSFVRAWRNERRMKRERAFVVIANEYLQEQEAMLARLIDVQDSNGLSQFIGAFPLWQINHQKLLNADPDLDARYCSLVGRALLLEEEWRIQRQEVNQYLQDREDELDHLMEAQDSHGLSQLIDAFRLWQTNHQKLLDADPDLDAWYCALADQALQFEEQLMEPGTSESDPPVSLESQDDDRPYWTPPPADDLPKEHPLTMTLLEMAEAISGFSDSVDTKPLASGMAALRGRIEASSIVSLVCYFNDLTAGARIMAGIFIEAIFLNGHHSSHALISGSSTNENGSGVGKPLDLRALRAGRRGDSNGSGEHRSVAPLPDPALSPAEVRKQIEDLRSEIDNSPVGRVPTSEKVRMWMDRFESLSVYEFHSPYNEDPKIILGINSVRSSLVTFSHALRKIEGDADALKSLPDEMAQKLAGEARILSSDASNPEMAVTVLQKRLEALEQALRGYDPGPDITENMGRAVAAIYMRQLGEVPSSPAVRRRSDNHRPTYDQTPSTETPAGQIQTMRNISAKLGAISPQSSSEEKTQIQRQIIEIRGRVYQSNSRVLVSLCGALVAAAIEKGIHIPPVSAEGSALSPVPFVSHPVAVAAPAAAQSAGPAKKPHAPHALSARKRLTKFIYRTLQDYRSAPLPKRRRSLEELAAA